MFLGARAWSVRAQMSEEGEVHDHIFYRGEDVVTYPKMVWSAMMSLLAMEETPPMSPMADAP